MSDSAETNTSRAVERAAREAYGQVLAFLAREWRDIAAAEDALQDALVRALSHWPANGIPANPAGWLSAVARNRLRDGARAAGVRSAASRGLAPLVSEIAESDESLPDRRLELLFVCAHPAIADDMHTPLMLQIVLGLDSAQIASRYLVSPASMQKRLTRVKLKIRDAGIPFDLPATDERPARLHAVLEAIYAAYGLAWDAVASDAGALNALSAETLWLVDIMAALMPGEAEALGLKALVLFCESRRDARIVDGRYFPLDEQDISLWNRQLIAAAEAALQQASVLGRPGRFQLEAAIQSALVSQRLTGRDFSRPLLGLYTALRDAAPTIGNHLGWCAALASAEGPLAGLAALDAMPADLVANYQPYWALRAHLLRRSGADAGEAFTRAIGLAESAAVRAYLTAQAATA